MTDDRMPGLGWTRRRLLSTGMAVAGTVALGDWAGATTPATSGELDALGRQLHGRFLTEGDAGYDAARMVWNRAYDRHPLAMARCADLGDVRRCLDFARAHGLAVAIRGGGHSYAGFGVADGALQVDLGAFNTVKIDAARRIASVGGGTRIKSLLAACIPHGLITPMGACGEVGVAGLALAGGDTAARGLYGTACDNIIGAQIVTADGEVRELGPGENEDLFWAIRGGGGNFGVVTRLDFRLHPILPMQNLAFSFGWTDIAGALRAFGTLIPESPDASRAGFFVDPVEGASASVRIYGDPAAAEAWFARWRKAFPGVEPRAYTSKPEPIGEIWNTTNLAVDGAFLEGIDDALADVLARAALAGRGVGDMLLGLSNGKAARIGMTETAYPLRGIGLSSLFSASWAQPGDKARAIAWVAETGAAIRPWAQRAYVNYLAPSSPERVREIYGVNYPRLAAIKARYDPENMFRSNQNILPAARG